MAKKSAFASSAVSAVPSNAVVCAPPVKQAQPPWDASQPSATVAPLASVALQPAVPRNATHFGFPHEPAGGGGAGVVVVGAGAGAGAGAGVVACPELDVDDPVSLDGSERSDGVSPLDVAPRELPLLRNVWPSGPAEQAAVSREIATNKKTRTFA